jgi:hypothetical protein
MRQSHGRSRPSVGRTVPVTGDIGKVQRLLVPLLRP